MNSELITQADGSIYHIALHPHQLADNVILVGDPYRVDRVSRHFDRIEHKTHHREFNAHTGFIRSKRFTVLSTGIGPDNIDIVLNELDCLASLDLATALPLESPRTLNIVRLGTSGALHPDIEAGSLLVSSAALGMDNLMRYYPSKSYEHPLAIEMNQHSIFPSGIEVYAASADPGLLALFHGFRQGITLTAPGFYGPQGRQLRSGSRLDETFWSALNNTKIGGQTVTNFEMETAAIYALSAHLGHRALSVSVILANRVHRTFADNPDQLIAQMIEKSLRLLCSLD